MRDLSLERTGLIMKEVKESAGDRASMQSALRDEG